MEKHQRPTPNPIAERFKFNSRNRQPGESISTYMSKLRRLTEYCEYGAVLDDMLRDRLVCGVRHERIQQKLLSEDKLTLKKATQITQSMESAVAQASEIQSYQSQQQTEEKVHRIAANQRTQNQNNNQNQSNQSSAECFRCGASKHNPERCPFKDKECFFCHNKGHTVPTCRKKAKKDQQIRKLDDERVKPSAATEEEFNNDLDFDYLFMYKLGLRREAPVVVKFKVNGQDLPMEVGTGASVSVMSHRVMKSILDESWPLRPSQAQLRTYSGEIIKPLGIVDVEVRYQGQRKMLPLVIIPSDGPTLVGRNWLKEIVTSYQ